MTISRNNVLVITAPNALRHEDSCYSATASIRAERYPADGETARSLRRRQLVQLLLETCARPLVLHVHGTHLLPLSTGF